MNYKQLIGDLFGITEATWGKIKSLALNTPLLGEAIAMAKADGFDARKKADWEKLYKTVTWLIEEREAFEQEAAKVQREMQEGYEFKYDGVSYKVSNVEDIAFFNSLRAVAKRSGLFRLQVHSDFKVYVDGSYYVHIGLPMLQGITPQLSVAKYQELITKYGVTKRDGINYTYATAFDIDELILKDKTQHIDKSLFRRAVASAQTKAHLESLYLTTV